MRGFVSSFVLFSQICLEIMTSGSVVTITHVENELSWVDRLDQSFELSVVRVRRIRHFKIEGQIAVVLVIPSSQNDENSWHFSIALVDVEAGQILD